MEKTRSILLFGLNVFGWYEAGGPWPVGRKLVYTGDLSFQVPDRRYLDEHNEHPLTSFYLVNAGGSPLSGKHSAICYDPKEKSLIHFGQLIYFP